MLILLLNYFKKSAYVDVVHFACRHVYKGLCVDDFHGIFANELELHDHYIILNVLQINVFTAASCLCLINRFSFQVILKLLLPLALNKKRIPMVRLLVNLVKIHRVCDRNKFWD